jgi:FkbH-like protein
MLAFVRNLENEGGLDAFQPVRIKILRNITLDLIVPYLTWHFNRDGLKAVVDSGGFDTVVQDVMSREIDDERMNIMVLALSLDRFQPDYDTAPWTPDGLAGRLFSLFELVSSRTRALIVINTFIRPRYPEHGILGGAIDTSLDARIGKVNRMIEDYAAQNPSRFCLLDWERIVMVLGYDAALDRRFDYLAAAPFRPAFLDLYAGLIARAGRALHGKNRKCLVLDCDGTLWGGIVGEDGMDGISLDRNTYPGKAYHDFQKTVVKLCGRGVLIALCSRNNEEDVWDVMDNHPACLIGRNHIAAARINWEDKVENIRGIARELNIGTDSVVFVDDSPVECHRVRTALPEVHVLNVPEKTYDLPDLLYRDGFFDGLSISPEDINRTTMVQAERKRRKDRECFEDLDSYLATLGLEARIHCLRESEIPRVSQLTLKTNQFNLRTVRYSEAGIREFIEKPGASVFTLSVRDTFGDYGLTGVFMAVQDGAGVFVDTLLLSCRVLGRKVEHAFVSHCLETVTRQWTPSFWKAEYVKTGKNSQVSDLWGMFGFKKTADIDGTSGYCAEPGDLVFHAVPYINVIPDEAFDDQRQS